MFRRLRYWKWLVAGVGVAALVVPTAALAGNNRSQVLDGRSPDTVDAALAAQPKIDPMIVEYLLRNGYTLQQIDAMGRPVRPVAAAQPKIDPMIVEYLLRNGYTRQQIDAMARPAPVPQVQTPVDGRSPDTRDFAVQAHAPVVTITRDPGFQWGDFGVGLGAAMVALSLLGITRLFSKRGGQRAVTTS